MAKPKEISFCPSCGGKLKLIKSKVQHGSGIMSFFFDKWTYDCSKCDLEFTTTESDTITMKNIEQTQKQ